MKLTPFKKLAFVLGASIILQGCVAAVLGGASVLFPHENHADAIP